jgi:phosphoglycerate dehydrogenase-like enzyme
MLQMLASGGLLFLLDQWSKRTVESVEFSLGNWAVYVSPNVSGFMPGYDDACTALFAENLRRYLAGAHLLNLVDRARGY